MKKISFLAPKKIMQKLKRVQKTKTPEKQQKTKTKELFKARESMETEPDKIHAVILYPKDKMEAKPVNVPQDEERFSFDNQTFNIRKRGVWRQLKRKLQLVPPFIKATWTLWAYYRAGNPEPLGYEQTDGFTAEDINVIDEQEITIEGMSDSMKGEKQKRQLGGLKWMILLVIALMGAAIAIFVLPGLLKQFGIFGGG